MLSYPQLIAQDLQLKASQVEAVLELLQADATIPFIARYRKEVTGSLDEVAITSIRDQHLALTELDKRRGAILSSLTERNLLTEELQASIQVAKSLPILEDLYLPFRPKRRTRASIAKERQLEPLATWLLEQLTGEVQQQAMSFVNEELGVPDAEAALAGARDIIAEQVAENSLSREQVRAYFARHNLWQSKVLAGKEEEGAKFRDYFAWEEPAAKAPSHRVLAMLRGAEEGFLRVSLRPSNEDGAREILFRLFVKNSSKAAAEVKAACIDSYARLLAPALETEQHNLLKSKADLEAIAVFAGNLQELLLSPALGAKAILAIDPGFRTGCKVVCLNAEGKLLENITINPHTTAESNKPALGKTLLDLVKKHNLEVACVGNGTAGRETEQFLRSIAGWPTIVPIVMVSESGASVYSASEVARTEFPDLDLTYRGAVSIGRRLADPLAELVKIDPKAIGVGQYQHDVDQAALKRSLDDVVMRCVNAVGVEVNTASEQLLTYVSGLGPTLAHNIVAYRHANGPFTTRKDLLKVTRLGPKAFEQCSGFLRIRGGSQPLDASAVHPESYKVVEQMAKDLQCKILQLMQDKALRGSIDLKHYVTDNLGLPTLTDIMQELEKPGRDPRSSFKPFAFTEGINSLQDLEVGMRLPGIVTNVTAFGAFVDMGVHQDGLVHISQLADKFIKHPSEVVKVQQEVMVTVMEIDKSRSRIALSLRKGQE